MSQEVREFLEREIAAAKIRKTLTSAQEILGKYTLLNERPDGMSFAEYKRIQKAQAKLIRSCLR